MQSVVIISLHIFSFRTNSIDPGRKAKSQQQTCSQQKGKQDNVLNVKHQ